MAKTRLTIFAVILSFVFLMSAASALSITSHSPSTLSQSSSSFNITVDSNATNLNVYATPSDNSIVIGSITKVSSTNTTTTFNIPYDTSSTDFQLLHSYSVKAYATNGTVNSSTLSISFASTPYCGDIGNLGNYLETYINNVNVNGFGHNEEYWYPGDNVSVDARIYNNGNYDLRNARVQWALYTQDGTKIDDGSMDSFTLRAGDERDVNFDFQLNKDLSRIEGNNVVLYVKTIAQVSDSNSIYNGNNTCSSSNSGDVNVIIPDDFVVVNDLQANSQTFNGGTLKNQSFACGSQITLSGNLWNIGAYTQDTSYLDIYSKNLGISKRIPFSTIDSFSSEPFSYTFTVPRNVSEQSYPIEFRVYDSNNHLYQSDDGYSTKNSYKLAVVKIQGNCLVAPPTLTASLSQSTVQAGKEMTVKTTITNPTNKEITYTLSSGGYNSWASLTSVSPQVLQIPAGRTMQANFTFNINKNAEGNKTFDIMTTFNNGQLLTQPVTVSIEKAPLFSGIFSGNNWQIIGIVLLNLILIIAIIIVAVRIFKKK